MVRGAGWGAWDSTHPAASKPSDLTLPVPMLDRRLRFPSPHSADAEGLVAVGGDLSVPRLLLAYRSGLFPWTVDPITWWSPEPRAIFELEEFHVSHSLARTIRKGAFRSEAGVSRRPLSRDGGPHPLVVARAARHLRARGVSRVAQPRPDHPERGV